MQTNIPIPEDNYAEAIDLLIEANVRGSDYIYMARSLAGPMMSQIGQVFPLHFSIVYLLTNYTRRQVWHSHIAGKYSNGPIPDPAGLRHKLLYWRSRDLLEDAHGAIPHGFNGAIERLGTHGQHAHIYTLLYQLMNNSEGSRKALAQSSRIKARTIEFMAMIPKDLCSVGLAEKFRRKKDLKALIFAVELLAGDDSDKRHDLCSKIKYAVDHGGSISRILKKEYSKTPFPAQVLPDNKHLRFIGNGDDLKRVSRKMKNCLADNYFADAIRGDYQFYVFVDGDEMLAAISIKEDRPYGWRIIEVQGPENTMIEDDLESKILEHFGNQGVFKMPDMETLTNGIGCAVRDDTDPVGHIENIVDDMLTNGAAA